jgi:hypothetical protein
MADETPKKAFGMGYIIADHDGRLQLHTLRSNRSESWRELGANDRKQRDFWKTRGFRCVFVIVDQSADE